MKKNPPDQRQFKRYKAHGGAYALIRNHASKLGQIIDISKGGLSFKYIAETEQISSQEKLDIIFPGQNIRLKDIPFKTVSDQELKNNTSFFSLRMRRCGLQFTELGNELLAKLVNSLKTT